jgi:hypothetical protein
MEGLPQPTPGFETADCLQQRIQELSAHEAGWGGPGSLPVKPDSLAKLLGILSSVIAANPDLKLAPSGLRTGGVQAEWHSGQKSAEVIVDPDGQQFAFATEGKDYHIAVGPTDALPGEVLQALCGFLSQMNPNPTPENT